MENYFINLLQNNPKELDAFAKEIKTSKQADLFEDEIFNNFNWEDFSLDIENYSLPVCDKLAQRLRILNHEEIGSWTFSFNTLLLPVSNKLIHLQLLGKKIAKDLSVTGSLNMRDHDNYTLASNYILSKQDEIIELLNSFISTISSKFSQPTLVKQMKSNVQSLVEQFEFLQEYNIDNIFASISQYDDTDSFAQKGIDADAAYIEGKRLLEEGKVKQAITLLEKIVGYRDAKELISHYSTIYTFHNALEIGGQTYLRKKIDNSKYYIYKLDENKIPCNNPLISNLNELIGSYAEYLYYISSENELTCYNLYKQQFEELPKTYKDFEIEKMQFSPDKSAVYIPCKDKSADYIIALNFKNNTITPITATAKSLCCVNENYVVYTATSQIEIPGKKKKNKQFETIESLFIYDIVNNKNIQIDNKKYIVASHLIGDTLVCLSEGTENFDIAICKFKVNTKFYEVEQNVCAIIDNDKIKKYEQATGKKYVFYKIGRADLYTVVAADISSMLVNEDEFIVGDTPVFEKVEIAKYVKETYIDHDEIYYTTDFPRANCLKYRKVANSSDKIIADNVLKIVGTSCNFVYYINTTYDLCRIYKNGTGYKLIFNNIHEVLNISSSKLFFDAVDDSKITIDDIQQEVEQIDTEEQKEIIEEVLPTAEETPISIDDVASEVQTTTEKKKKEKKPKKEKKKKEKKPKVEDAPVVVAVKKDSDIQDFMIKSSNINGTFYCMDLDGNNLRKIAYNIYDADVYKNSTFIDVLTRENQGLVLYRYDTLTSNKTLIMNIVDNPEVAKKKKGCYVATCVFGSYECPEVRTLRRFRDTYLQNSLLGRAFIKVYYALSPTAVKLFGNTVWFNKFFKKRLNKLVNKLNNKGYENTDYTD